MLNRENYWNGTEVVEILTFTLLSRYCSNCDALSLGLEKIEFKSDETKTEFYTVLQITFALF